MGDERDPGLDAEAADDIQGVALAARLPHPLASAAAVALRGSIYLFGGDGSDAVLRLTPKTP
jgi:hypothetical protein